MSNRAYLFSLEHFGIKLGLEQITALLGHLDHPERAFRSILVAGTNGKGSVAAMVERGLRAAGIRTGRYTSPHLIALEERFAVGGVSASPAAVDAAIGRVRAAAARMPTPPSFFEAATATAFEVFKAAGVEIAVLEVGLGGRLDATNVTDPIAVAITSISLDHEQLLGNTIAAIAAEKAAVIRRGALVVVGENDAAVRDVVGRAADAAGATLIPATTGVTVDTRMVGGRTELTLTTPRRRYDVLHLALRGRHQVANGAVAVRLLEELDASGQVAVPTAAVRASLEDVTWPGRLDLRAWHGGEVLIDGMHNPAGARTLAAYVREAYGRRLPMVVGVMKDKRVDDLIAALCAMASHFVFTAPASHRAAAPADLRARAAAVAPGVASEVVLRPLDAIGRAIEHGSPVVVAGSLYLAGEVLAGLP